MAVRGEQDRWRELPLPQAERRLRVLAEARGGPREQQSLCRASMSDRPSGIPTRTPSARATACPTAMQLLLAVDHLIAACRRRAVGPGSIDPRARGARVPSRHRPRHAARTARASPGNDDVGIFTGRCSASEIVTTSAPFCVTIEVMCLGRRRSSRS